MNSTTLTASQLSIWASHKLKAKSKASYLPHTFEIFGEINSESFKKAFAQLIRNNDSLRTTINEDESGNVEQTVHDEFGYQLELIEIDNKESLNTLVKTRTERHLDLSKCSFDSVLIKISSTHHVWYLNVHHILADATSFKILFDEMAMLYDATCSHIALPTPSKATFSEFRAFEQAKRRDQESVEHRYWVNKGQGNSNRAVAYGNPKSPGRQGAIRIPLSLNEKALGSFNEILNFEDYKSLNQDLTKFTLWATFYTAFLSRILGESLIRIGSPFPNRNLPKFKNTTGLLIEVLPIDVHINENETFKSLFQKVRKEFYDFFRNGYPGAQELDKSGGIHFVINYIPLYFGRFGDLETTTEWLFPNELDQSHQLRLQAFDFNDALNTKYYLDVNEDYFTNQQLEFIGNHFENLIQGCLSNHNMPLNSIPLVASNEHYGIDQSLVPQIKHKGSDTLEKLIRNSLRGNLKKTAVTSGTTNLTYEQLDGYVNSIAELLLSHGITYKSKVALRKQRSADYLAIVLATLRVGAVFVPIPTDLPDSRSLLILEDTKPDLIVSSNWIETPYKTINISLSKLEETPLSPQIKDSLPEHRVAYILYTSGSSGKPKGVEVSTTSLCNYINEAKRLYSHESQMSMPFFTSIGFDLTITSMFLPLVTGGLIQVFPESSSGPDVSILEVVKSESINAIKLTPSHAQLVRDEALSSSIKCLIFGGEDLETDLATAFQKKLSGGGEIYNEYGPTEATVGCIVHKYNPEKDKDRSVPIGLPIEGCLVYVLDNELNPVPDGVAGNLFLGGKVLANGYWANQPITSEAFISDPFNKGKKLYKTGDKVRINPDKLLEYLGRVDDQIKLNGVRIEARELEDLLAQIPGVEEAYICVADSQPDLFVAPTSYCNNCGIPSNYPHMSFNNEGVCNLCESFEQYKRNVSAYFKDLDNLKTEILSLGEKVSGSYDCMMLLSGGKDSSYALAQLKALGLNVLAFTLDNGFISDNAKENINNTTSKLGVDHIYGTTEAMNAIFRDSLERHQNVCNGCFKTLYTLSTKLALEKNIPVIVTGLSRGQFFETRLTEELFIKEDFDPTDIDNIILEARKSYHRSRDAVSEHLDVSIFEDDRVFEKVAFLDFYRFSDVSLSEMLSYLENKIGWVRPKDTGRSTNCIINDLGIYVHKRKRGYHNYAFPYSWDVRVGHKKREETIHELNDELSLPEIKDLMQQIGLEDIEPHKEIRAYYRSKKAISQAQLVEHLQQHLPWSMIPSIFYQVEKFPLTPNGKIDKNALLMQKSQQGHLGDITAVNPENKIEQMVHDTWSNVLKIDSISTTDSFIAIGGNSLAAIRIISQLNKRLNMEISIQTFFEENTIKKLSKHIEEKIRNLMGVQQ